MLDGQFSAQNGGNGAANPGLSFVVAPPGNSASPEPNKWIAPASVKRDGRKIQITDNMSTMDRVILCSSEFCGTAILVFLGCVGCVDFGKYDHPPVPPSSLQICLTFGFAVMVAVQCFGHVSGAHINPLVTVAAVTMGNIPLIQVPIYLVGQILGAFGGFGLLQLAIPRKFLNDTNPGVCSPGLERDVSAPQGFLIEFIISFILALVCCGVWDARNTTKHDSVPIRFGFTITVLAFVGAPYTGANMNPARSFAPAAINGNWDDHWVYWLGPLAGGFLAALLYRFVFTKERPEEEQIGVVEGISFNDKA